MNIKTWILPVLSALLFADTVLAATLYENDFEALGKLNFRGSFGPRWIGDLKTAERQGHVKIHRKGLCEQGEKSHSGVMSYVLDLTVDKSTGKWGGTCSFDFPWNNRTSLTAYQAEIQVDGERLRSNEIRPLFCGKAERRPRIDGNLEEFRHLPGIRLGAAQQISLYQAKIRNSADLGAVVYFQYDDSFFYIAAEVVDDLHQVPHEQPNMYWANDALQLLFVMSGKRSKLSSRDLLELAVTGTKQGGRISTTLLEQKLDFSRAEVAVVRRNGKTFYELALPWETLSKGFRPDNSVNPGFNLAVSDNDGNPEISRMPKLKGYEKSLQMSRGLVDSKDPSSALILFFEQK